MQQLQFENAWERTIAAEDKQLIERTFEVTKDKIKMMTFIREAHNHQQSLLVTVLVHNRTTEELTIEKTPIAYTNGQQETACATFTLPFPIPPHTTMPWTFIFPEDSECTDEPVFHITWSS